MDVPPEILNIPHVPDLLKVAGPKFINCHKATLYIADTISYSELIADPQPLRDRGEDYWYSERAKGVSDIPFLPITDTCDLQDRAAVACAKYSPCIGQILDTDTGELAHSFLIVSTSLGLVCFDKSGFKEPFTTYSIEELLEKPNYQNQAWRFVPLSVVN